MPETVPSELRAVRDLYSTPGMEWAVRGLGPHFHPGSEDATVALAERSVRYGLEPNSRILEVASALGAPARYLARKFVSTVICVDMDRQMHAAAGAANTAEGLSRRCLRVLARTERIPLRDNAVDAAWSQDALCHMDKAAVLRELARVVRPAGLIAFSDWIAKPGYTEEDAAAMATHMAFPSLFTLPQYVAALEREELEVLLAEDRTRALRVVALPPEDQEEFEQAFAAKWGDKELARQQASSAAWRDIVSGGRGGYALFVARVPV
ncbi:MAG TPA: class I SAM-dependent methyltransferase [Tepidiformaceae bacterium]|nr:class I SAM-dependent methyltransferase [Tepidiformaceae bacterium]